MDALSKILRKLMGTHPTLQGGLHEARILELWPQAVGASISKHTRAKSLRGKSLVVEVDHPIWKKELHAHQRLALKKLNELIATFPELLDPETKTPWVIQELFLVNASNESVSPQPRYNHQKQKYGKRS